MQIEDVLSDPAYRRGDAQRTAGYRTVMGAPMLLDDEVVGVLSMWRTAVDPFDEQATTLATAFAAHAAVAIRNAHLMKALEQRSAELEVAGRHKSEFLASMSHELRTPLNAVIGFSEVLLERMFGELNERQDEYLHDILDSGRHLLELLNDILDLSKVEAGAMGWSDRVRPGRVGGVRPFHGAGTRGPARHPARRKDGPRRRPPLRRRAAGQAGAAQPAVQRGQVHPARWIGRRDHHALRRRVVIAVGDTGVGIPVEDQERVFESFQQGTRPRNAARAPAWG